MTPAVFATLLLRDWDNAMDDFFSAVDKTMEKSDISPEQVQEALRIGYGSEVRDAWNEWNS